MKSKLSQTQMKELTGKAAVFVRGFGEYMLEQHRAGHGNVRLRAAQEAGRIAVVDAGETISVPYISQLSSKIEAAGIYEKRQSGKSYVLHFTDESIEKMQDLLDTPYGTEVRAEISVHDLRARNAIINHLSENDGVVIYNDAPLPKASYGLLIERFKKGQLVMAFVTPEAAEALEGDHPPFVESRL